MEYKIIILSVACFSLLTPPALALAIGAGNSDSDKAEETSLAVEDTSLAAADTSLTAGLAIKGLAALMAVKGLAALALKAALFKGALLAKCVVAALGIGSALMSQKPVSVPKPPCDPCSNTNVPKPHVPNKIDIISGAVENKLETVNNVVDAIKGQGRVIVKEPVVYEYVRSPKFYSVPVMEEYEIDTFK